VIGRGRFRRSHRQRVLKELARSYGHLRAAAGHAATGAADRLTTPYGTARTIAAQSWSTTKGAISPLYDQVREGAATARKERRMAKMKKRRWPVFAGLLAAGAAVGAAGAMIARRRRATAAQWNDFEPIAGIDDIDSDFSERGIPDRDISETGAGVGHRISSGAAAVASKISTGAAAAADRIASAAGRTAETTGSTSPSGSAATGGTGTRPATTGSSATGTSATGTTATGTSAPGSPATAGSRSGSGPGSLSAFATGEKSSTNDRTN
jgi:hypothetical protein